MWRNSVRILDHPVFINVGLQYCYTVVKVAYSVLQRGSRRGVSVEGWELGGGIPSPSE